MHLIGRNPAAGQAFAAIALGLFGAAIACAQSPAASPTASAPSGVPVVLDRVVAVINDVVILESDVDEEMRFADLQGPGLQSGKSAEQNALERLIDRDLIMQQINATQSPMVQ